MAIHDYEQLFDEWGEHMTNIGIKYIYCHGKQRDDFERRNTRRFLIKTRKKVLGRAERIYRKIRNMNGYIS